MKVIIEICTVITGGTLTLLMRSKDRLKTIKGG